MGWTAMHKETLDPEHQQVDDHAFPSQPELVKANTHQRQRGDFKEYIYLLTTQDTHTIP